MQAPLDILASLVRDIGKANRVKERQFWTLLHLLPAGSHRRT